MLRTALTTTLLLSTLGGLSACSFAVRSPDMYRDDTAKVLATKSGEIQGCYDAALKGKPGTAGKVTVKFTVEEATGKFSGISVDKANTTLPEDISACVTKAIEGLTLTPGDSRKGDATFVYELTAPAAPAAAPAAAAPAAAAPAAAAPAAPGAAAAIPSKGTSTTVAK